MINSGDLSLDQPSVAGPPWGRRDVMKAALLIFVGGLVLIVLASVLLFLLDTDPTTVGGLSSPLLFGVAAGLYLLVLLAVYLFAVRRADGSWAPLGVRGFDWRWWPALAPIFFVQLAGMGIINTLIVPLFTGAEFENPQIDAITGGLSLSPRDLVLLLLLIAVVAPVAEELFFRGMLYPVLRRRWGPGWAIFLNAALFALVHFIPLLLPGLFYIGLVLAWVRERSGSVIPCIILHAIQNGLVVIGIFALMGM
jgi:uncharacterized protein